MTPVPSDTVRERAPTRARWHLPVWPEPWWPAAAISTVAAGGLAAFLAPLGGVHVSRLNGLGLISVLPVVSLLGITVLAVAFSVGLCLPRAYPTVLGATLAGMVICLDGVTVFTEPEPRFPTSYQIAGFIEYVSRTGHTAPGLDAYFSWPGFFGVVAFLQRITGHYDMIPVLRWWPVTIDMACLVPLYLIMRNLRASWRAKWLAAFLFEVGNWVGQDYFSPQSFNYLLYLAFIAILLTWFGLRPRAATPPPPAKPEASSGIVSWLRSSYSMLVPGEIESRPSSRAERAMLLAILLGIFVVSVTSHQLTPFDMIAACLGLVAVRRCTITGLPVLLAVIVTGWVSFAAVGFWSGHLSALFGDLGNLGGNLTSSVTDRITGTAQHMLVLDVRTAYAAGFLLMAAGGVLRRRRRVTDDRVLITLMCMPFLAFGTQSYGGEIGLRVYLFALPAAAVLAACLFFPATRDGGGRPWRVFLPVAVCAVTLVIAFLVTRYGNEAFEQTPPGELAAYDYLYAHDADSMRLLWLSPDPAVDDTPQMPWEYRDIEKINFMPELAPRDPGSDAGLLATLRAAGPGSYLITTSSQETYLNQVASYPVSWGGDFRARMAATQGVRTVFANADAVIYTMQWPRDAPLGPLVPGTASPASGSTLWTPTGLVILSLLLLVLTAREFIRVCLGAPPLPIGLLTRASLPLLVAFIGVVILRFTIIS